MIFCLGTITSQRPSNSFYVMLIFSYEHSIFWIKVFFMQRPKVEQLIKMLHFIHATVKNKNWWNKIFFIGERWKRRWWVFFQKIYIKKITKKYSAISRPFGVCILSSPKYCKICVDFKPYFRCIFFNFFLYCQILSFFSFFRHNIFLIYFFSLMHSNLNIKKMSLHHWFQLLGWILNLNDII